MRKKRNDNNKDNDKKEIIYIPIWKKTLRNKNNLKISCIKNKTNGTFCWKSVMGSKKFFGHTTPITNSENLLNFCIKYATKSYYLSCEDE